MTAGGESDIGSVDGMMPEEVEAAYQVFIQYLSSRKFEYSCCKILYFISFILKFYFRNS